MSENKNLRPFDIHDFNAAIARAREALDCAAKEGGRMFVGWPHDRREAFARVVQADRDVTAALADMEAMVEHELTAQEQERERRSDEQMRALKRDAGIHDDAE